MAHLNLFAAFRIRRLRVVFAFMGLLALFITTSRPANACGYGVCNNDYSMFQPFMGTPYVPQGYGYYYQTGQMYQPYYPAPFDPVYASNVLNWNGAQPLGLSYSPPLGSSAIFNDLVYSSMTAR
jgi:hypothetical protein